MARGKALSEEKRMLTIELSKSEKKKTLVQIAADVGCSERTVRNILKLHLESGNLKPKRQSGRPLKLSKSEERYIYLLSKRDRFKTAPSIAFEFNKPPNSEEVHRHDARPSAGSSQSKRRAHSVLNIYYLRALFTRLVQ